jgi:hypothetical protein
VIKDWYLKCERIVVACYTKSALLNVYQAATARHIDSVTVLSTQIGKGQKSEYDRLWLISDTLRKKSEEARISLERHTGCHGC